MGFPSLTWDGDNAQLFEQFLSQHLVRADKHGDKLHLIGIGLNVELALGDRIMLDGDRLGIVRAGGLMPPDVLVWDGTNVPAFNEFLSHAGVWLLGEGEYLTIYAGSQPMATLNRGDRLEKREGQIAVSRAGKDHRN